MGRVKRWGGIGAAVALSLASSACGSGAGGDLARLKTPGSTAADPLTRALLPASAFGPEPWRPENTKTLTDALAASPDAGCRWLIIGGPRGSEQAADSLGDTTTGLTMFYERVARYQPGDASITLAEMWTQAIGKCSAYTYTAPDGLASDDTMTAWTVPGLGDQAYFFELQQQPTGTDSPVVYNTVAVQYGDTLITVTCLGSDAYLESCAPDQKVRAIAARLRGPAAGDATPGASAASAAAAAAG